MLRSADMSYVTLNVPDDEAGIAIQKVATKFRKLHMIDISLDDDETVQRAKRTKLKMADLTMMERKLDEFESLMAKYDIEMTVEADEDFDPIGVAPGQNRNLAEEMKQWFRGKSNCDERDLNGNINAIKRLEIQINELDEKIEVLEFAKGFPSLYEKKTGGAGYQTELADVESGEKKTSSADREGYKVIWGTIPTHMKSGFKRTLARVSRFNAVPYFSGDEIRLLDKGGSNELISKVPFYVVTVGKYISSAFTERLAQYMNIVTVEVPSSKLRVSEALEKYRKDRSDMMLVLKTSKAALRKTLRKFASSETKEGQTFCPIKLWQSALRQEKAILDATLKIRWQRNFVEMAGWVPSDDVGTLIQIVNSELSGRSNVSVRSAPGPNKGDHGEISSPPTYFPTNSFTEQFQSIVDTYGIATYKEINPGLFTIVTFPFLFGVMYGDIGHGGFMALMGGYLVANGAKHEEMIRKGKLGELLSGMHEARYVLFFMGLFGFYCGSIYNDLFSVPLSIFSTRWDNKGYWQGSPGGGDDQYPYGVDPSWYGTTNQLQFMNSLKMKLSVILGVTQMTFGIALGALNHIYEGDYLGLIFEWVPRMLFMCCTFGYMIGIIIYKWCVNWENRNVAPPSLIQTMIKMFLAPGIVEEENELYDGQAEVQLYLILIAIASVPIMLFAKPLIKHFCCHGGRGGGRNSNDGYGEFGVHGGATELKSVVTSTNEKTGLVGNSSSNTNRGYGSLDDDERDHKQQHGSTSSHHDDGDDDDDEHGGIGEIMIHQGIHTIEFVLGCVSNTASYLRLWALSLAHAELAEVFWSKLIMGLGLESGAGALGLVIGFAAWFSATFAVLICMDTMECVLHALRLHWVEFQNKFYRAEGYKFVALDFLSKEFVSGE